MRPGGVPVHPAGNVVPLMNSGGGLVQLGLEMDETFIPLLTDSPPPMA